MTTSAEIATNPKEPNAGRTKLLADLRIAAELARGLLRTVEHMFPESADSARRAGLSDLTKKSLEEQITSGEKAIADLKEIGFRLAPEAAMNALEHEMCTDHESQAKARLLLAKLKA